MALIPCSGCGKQISDKAAACPHCGQTVEPGILCEECGSRVPMGKASCPNCGCPISEPEAPQKAEMPRKKKNWLLPLGAVAVIVLAVLCFWKPAEAEDAGQTVAAVPETTMAVVTEPAATMAVVTEPEKTRAGDLRQLTAGVGLDEDINYYLVWVMEDGTVKTSGENSYGQLEVEAWTDIVSIGLGEEFTVGLKSDGTVVTAGSNEYGQCNVEDWTDIVQISTGMFHTAGLKRDGTVVATGLDGGQCEVSDWQDIVAISAGTHHTIGLKADGTVVVAGENYWGENNVGSWKDIVQVAGGLGFTAGLRSDGTVVLAGVVNGDSSYKLAHPIEEWEDIVQIGGSYDTLWGRTSDCTVINSWKYGVWEEYGDEVAVWRDVAYLMCSCNSSCMFGITADGAVVNSTNPRWSEQLSGIRMP